jgi:hypothetical protein
MRRTDKSKTYVWRWQERFMEAGYDSLLHDKMWIPIYSGRVFRREAGPRSDLKPATIPK